MAQSGSVTSRSERVLALESKGRIGPLVTLQRFSRSSPIGIIGAMTLLVVILVAILAPLIAPYDPLAPDYGVTQIGPSSAHILGTDHLGRDVLSRIIHGSRITLWVGIASVILGNSVGFIWGVGSGYTGSKFDILSQRLVEVLMAFPTLILAMMLIAALGTGRTTVIVAVGVTQIPVATRVTRSVVLSVKQTAYVEAANALGASSMRIMIRHIAPQCVAPALVIATLGLGGAIFAEAALSFLGVGVPPPNPSWGNMLGGVLAQAFRPPWWLVLFPGIAIGTTVLAVNLLGDALRDFLDPRLSGITGR